MNKLFGRIRDFFKAIGTRRKVRVAKRKEKRKITKAKKQLKQKQVYTTKSFEYEELLKPEPKLEPKAKVKVKRKPRKPPKLTKAQQEAKRYASVRNATADIDLARQARKWSDKRIKEELGVIVPKYKKIVPLKPIPTDPKVIKRKQRRLNKYQYGRSIGLDYDEATKLKQNAKKRIKSTKDYIDQRELDLNIAKLPQTRQGRLELWREWAREESLPPKIHKIAREINRTTTNKEGRLDDTDRYGYAVAFYAFIENESYDNMREKIKVNRYDGNRYEDHLKVRNVRA